MVDDSLVDHCPSYKEAIRLCINLSGFTNKQVCQQLGIDPGHFSRIMSGTGHFPDDKLPDLMAICGNYAPLQWLARTCKFKLVRRSDTEAKREQLMRQLKELDAQEVNCG